MDLEVMQADIRAQISQSPSLKIQSSAVRLQHCVTGLSEEVGEVSGLLKRQAYKGLEVPLERWVDELGDVLWYWLAVCEALGIDGAQVFTYNKRKLKERYKHGTTQA